MTQKEALALLNITEGQDPAEQLDLVFFEYKQKIYRQLDQVLLYPKWISALKNLSLAAETLEFPFAYRQEKALDNVTIDTKISLVGQYNQLQQIKVKVAHSIYNSAAPKNTWEILEDYECILKMSFAFWAEAKLPDRATKLSQQFDPIAILAALKDLAQKGICHLSEINEQNTPPSLKEWIAWNKALQAKSSEN